MRLWEAAANLSAGTTLAIPQTLTTGAIVPTAGDIAADRVRSSYEECARIVRHRARNFFHGLRLTPEPRRSAIYSIYAWMRAADDEADTPVDQSTRHQRLRRFRGMTERVLSGTTPESDWPSFWPAFAATAWSYPIDPVIFRDMLDGLEEDLDHAAYETDEALSRYCYRVAGTAGLACVWIWGLRPGADASEATRLSLLRGQAFQRTNILRDFAQDHDGSPSRVYLPTSALAAAGLTSKSLRAWAEPDKCERFVCSQAAIARRQYEESEPLVSMIDPSCAPTLWAMTRIYSGILEIIERTPKRVVESRRIRLGGLTKASIGLRAAVRARVSGF